MAGAPSAHSGTSHTVACDGLASSFTPSRVVAREAVNRRLSEQALGRYTHTAADVDVAGWSKAEPARQIEKNDASVGAYLRPRSTPSCAPWQPWPPPWELKSESCRGGAGVASLDGRRAAASPLTPQAQAPLDADRGPDAPHNRQAGRLPTSAAGGHRLRPSRGGGASRRRSALSLSRTIRFRLRAVCDSSRLSSLRPALLTGYAMEDEIKPARDTGGGSSRVT